MQFTSAVSTKGRRAAETSTVSRSSRHSPRPAAALGHARSNSLASASGVASRADPVWLAWFKLRPAKSLRRCDNYVTAPESRDVLTDQVANIHALRADAESRGWTDRLPATIRARPHRPPPPPRPKHIDPQRVTRPRGPDDATAQQGDRTSSRSGEGPVPRYRLDATALVVARRPRHLDREKRYTATARSLAAAGDVGWREYHLRKKTGTRLADARLSENACQRLWCTVAST
jgi:hypothetical protein